MTCAVSGVRLHAQSSIASCGAAKIDGADHEGGGADGGERRTSRHAG